MVNHKDQTLVLMYVPLYSSSNKNMQLIELEQL